MLAVNQNTVPVKRDCVGAKSPGSGFYGVRPALYRGFAAGSIANVGCEVFASFVWSNPLQLDMNIAEAVGVVERNHRKGW